MCSSACCSSTGIHAGDDVHCWRGNRFMTFDETRGVRSGQAQFLFVLFSLNNDTIKGPLTFKHVVRRTTSTAFILDSSELPVEKEELALIHSDPTDCQEKSCLSSLVLFCSFERNKKRQKLLPACEHHPCQFQWFFLTFGQHYFYLTRNPERPFYPCLGSITDRNIK